MLGGRLCSHLKSLNSFNTMFIDLLTQETVKPFMWGKEKAIAFTLTSMMP